MDPPQLIEIRRLEPSDWRAYKKIRLEALRTEPLAFTSTYEDALRIPDEAWQSRLETSLLLFAISEGVPIGMMGAYEESDTTICIVSAYVQPDFRGKGLGQSLIQSIIREIGITDKRIVLDVYSNQKAAIHVYEKAGFTYTGEAPSTRCERMQLDRVTASQ